MTSSFRRKDCKAKFCSSSHRKLLLFSLRLFIVSFLITLFIWDIKLARFICRKINGSRYSVVALWCYEYSLKTTKNVFHKFHLILFTFYFVDEVRFVEKTERQGDRERERKKEKERECGFIYALI